MFALTVKQPWALFIAMGLKTVENRSFEVPIWARSDPKVGLSRPVGIHVSQTLPSPYEARQLFEWARANLHMTERFDLDVAMKAMESSAGHIVAVVELGKSYRDPNLMPGGSDVWWRGPVGWELHLLHSTFSKDVYRGQLGIWSTDAVKPEQLPATKDWFRGVLKPGVRRGY